MRQRRTWRCLLLGLVLLAGVLPASADLQVSEAWDSASELVQAAEEETLDLTAELLQVGLFDNRSGEWHFMNSDGSVQSFYYGVPGDLPLLGDWDCDGVDTVGMFRPSNGFVYLRNTNTFGVADTDFFYGIGGDVPLAGDFDGDGCDTLAIYRPSEGRVYVSNRLGTHPADFDFYFGMPGDRPFAGDFDGDGKTTVGLYRDTAGFAYFRDSLTTGVADYEFYYGVPSDRIVVGDWDCSGDETVGIFRPSDMSLYLSNENKLGPADLVLTLEGFNHSDLMPVGGDYRGHQNIEPPAVSAMLLDEIADGARSHSVVFEPGEGFERMDFYGADLAAGVPPDFALLIAEDDEEAVYVSFDDAGRVDQVQLGAEGTLSAEYRPNDLVLTMVAPGEPARSVSIPFQETSSPDLWPTVAARDAADDFPDPPPDPGPHQPFTLVRIAGIEAHVTGQDLPLELTRYFDATTHGCQRGSENYETDCHVFQAGQAGSVVRMGVAHHLTLHDAVVEPMTVEECEAAKNREFWKKRGADVVLIGVGVGLGLLWSPAALGHKVAWATGRGIIGKLLSFGAGAWLEVDCSKIAKVTHFQQDVLPLLEASVAVSTDRPPGWKFIPDAVVTDGYFPFIEPADSMRVDFELIETRGSITGQVFDESEALVPGADVKLDWVHTDGYLLGERPIIASQTTGGDALFNFFRIPEGTYLLTASKAGYRTKTGQVRVAADGTTYADVVLKKESVETEPASSFSVDLYWGGSYSTLKLHLFGPDSETGNERFHAHGLEPEPVSYAEHAEWDETVYVRRQGGLAFVTGTYQVSIENAADGYWGIRKPLSEAEASISVSRLPAGGGPSEVIWEHALPFGDPGFSDIDKTHWVVLTIDIQSEDGEAVVSAVDEFLAGSPVDRFGP